MPASIGSGARSALTVALVMTFGCAARPERFTVTPDPRPYVACVAHQVITDAPDVLPFDWGEGVLMAGMVRAGAVLNDEALIDYVAQWAEHWNAYGISRVLEGGQLEGYCGHWGPGFALMLLYEHTGDARYREMARPIVNFIQNKATRTKHDGLGHWRDNHQLWLDTLYMACPLLASFYQQNAPMAEESAVQLTITRQFLQDEKTGLFYHMYDEPSAKRVGELWGRGNGWVAMSLVETLRYAPSNIPSRTALRRFFRRQADGLIATQDPQTGLWHTVLNRPDSYLETSASAMITFSLYEGWRLGYITLDDPRVIQRAWHGLTTQVDENNHVIGVSAGTGPTTYENYVRIPQGTYTWGTGAFLLAGSALTEHARPNKDL